MYILYRSLNSNCIFLLQNQCYMFFFLLKSFFFSFDIQLWQNVCHVEKKATQIEIPVMTGLAISLNPARRSIKCPSFHN